MFVENELSRCLRSQNSEAKQREKPCKNETVNSHLYNWFLQARAKNISLSGQIMQKKALDIAAALNLTQFKASNGWLDSFKKRHKIAFGAACGETGDVNMEQKDIANCDETTLFLRALPTKSLHVKGESCRGGKFSKERLTVFLCVFGDVILVSISRGKRRLNVPM